MAKKDDANCKNKANDGKNDKIKQKKIKKGNYIKDKDTAKKRRLALTQAQEEFIIHIVQGESQRSAYRAAYPNCKSSDAAVDVKACQLLKMDKVRIRYEALLDNMRRGRENRALINGTKVENELMIIGFGGKKYPTRDMFGNELEAYPTVPQRLKALDSLNKTYNTTKDTADYGRSGGAESGEITINIKVFSDDEEK